MGLQYSVTAIGSVIFAERGQYARFHCGCSGYGIRENQRIFVCPSDALGDDGDLGRAEYGREEAEANP